MNFLKNSQLKQAVVAHVCKPTQEAEVGGFLIKASLVFKS